MYFNENDRQTAKWLKKLYPQATVDDRSIVDVTAADVAAFSRVHFFGGIGGWEYALRLAGWPDEWEVWTGSCPCQPFSCAGKGEGKSDKRHLWPEFKRLIAERMPATIFGEQVASKLGREWLDGVCADLEALGYAFGATDLCAASAGEEAEGRILRGDQISYERIVVSAPHIRQRLYWVADNNSKRLSRRQEQNGRANEPGEPASRRADALRCGSTGWMADTTGSSGPEQRGESGNGIRRGPQATDAAEHSRSRGLAEPQNGRCANGIGDSGGADSERRGEPDAFRRSTPRRLGDSGLARLEGHSRDGNDGNEPGRVAQVPAGHAAQASGSGFWGDFGLVACRDGKTRRIEPGPQQMADGFSEVLGRLRPDASQEIEKEIIRADISKDLAREALRNLWCDLAAQAVQGTTGRFRSVYEAPVLLAVMRELAREGWRLLNDIPSACWETAEGGLRALRQASPETACSSQGRRSVEQRSTQLGDAVSVVSQAIAFEAAKAGMIPFPLSHGVPNRVGRLRGYGNAIIPQVAAEFIGAFKETIFV